MGGDAPPTPERLRKRDLARAVCAAEFPRAVFTVFLVVLSTQFLTGRLSSSAPPLPPPPSLLRAGSQQDVYARALEVLAERRGGESGAVPRPQAQPREFKHEVAAPQRTVNTPPLTALPLGAIVVVFGTRPEAVKMLPLIRALHAKGGARPIAIVNTGQHDELLHSTLAALGGSGSAHSVDIDLDIAATVEARDGPATIGAAILEALSHLFAASTPALVVVQGDTTTAAFAAMAAYLGGIPIAHVEAGLRSFSGVTPFPEEFFRTLVTSTALLHLAPTHHAANMLASQGNVRGRVHVVGNTGVDGTHAALLTLTSEGAAPPAPTLAALFAGTALSARLAHVPALAGAGLAALTNSYAPLGVELAASFVPHKSAAAGLPVFAKMCHPFCTRGSEVDNSTCLQQRSLHALSSDESCGVSSGEVWFVFTMHRRESFGAPFERIARAIGDLIEAHHPLLHIVWPLHPNPSIAAGIQAALSININGPLHHVDSTSSLSSHSAHDGEPPLTSVPPLHLASHLHIVDPLPADEITALLLVSDAVITDSGGLQEEAVTLGRHVFVTRETTERPEGLATGLMHIVGTDGVRLSAEVDSWLETRCSASAAVSSRAARTYGDGAAGIRSAALMLAALDGESDFIADGQHNVASVLTGLESAPATSRLLFEEDKAASPFNFTAGPPSHERFAQRLTCSAQPAEPPAPLEEYDAIMAQPSDYSFVTHGADASPSAPFTWTAIVGTYRRVKFLPRMIAALLAQSHPPVEVWITTFASPHEAELREVTRNFTDPRVKFVAGDPQLKYFGRFQIAAQAPSNHVAFFDDDCIPGSLVIQNAFHVMYVASRRYYGLLGMKGHWGAVEAPVTHVQAPYHLAWEYRPSAARPVDLTGGLWFLRKDWLHHMFRDNFFTAETGEDFQLTYTLQKYVGLPTHLLPVHTGEAATWPHSADYFDVAKGTESTNGRLWDMRPIIFFHMVQRGYVPAMHAETWGEYHSGSNVLVFIDHVDDARALRGLLRVLERDYGHAVRPLLVLSGGPGAGRTEAEIIPALGRLYTPHICCYAGVWDLFLRKFDAQLYSSTDIFTETLYGARGVMTTTRPALVILPHRHDSPFAQGVAAAAAEACIPAAALLLADWTSPKGALATYTPTDGAPHTNVGAGHMISPAHKESADETTAHVEAEAASVLSEAQDVFEGTQRDAVPPLSTLNYASTHAGLLLQWLVDVLCACERQDSKGVGAYAQCPWRTPAVPTPTPAPPPPA